MKDCVPGKNPGGGGGGGNEVAPLAKPGGRGGGGRSAPKFAEYPGGGGGGVGKPVTGIGGHRNPGGYSGGCDSEGTNINEIKWKIWRAKNFTPA